MKKILFAVVAVLVLSGAVHASDFPILDPTSNGIISGLKLAKTSDGSISWTAGKVFIDGGIQDVSAGTKDFTSYGSYYFYATKSSSLAVGTRAPEGAFVKVGFSVVVWAIPFNSGGTSAIGAGAVITGATSGATATVVSVYVSSGSWAGGDAAGTLYVNNNVGTFTPVENLNVGTATNLATATSQNLFITRIHRALPLDQSINATEIGYDGPLGSAFMSKNSVNATLDAPGTEFLWSINGTAKDLGENYTGYEKCGLFVDVYSEHDRPTTGPLTPDLSYGINDVVGSDIRSTIKAGNMMGRAWPLYLWAECQDGADGVLNGIEMGVRNNGIPSSALGTHTSKQGVAIHAMGNPIAAGISLRQGASEPFGPGYFHEGIHIDQQAIVAAMPFTSGGTGVIAEGATITGASSGVTAVVNQVYVTSGAWADGDAAGTLYIQDESGAFTPGENLNVGASLNVATATTAPVAGYALRLQRFGNSPTIANKDYFLVTRGGKIFTEGGLEVTGSANLRMTGGGGVILNNTKAIASKEAAGTEHNILGMTAADDVFVGAPVAADGGADLLLYCDGVLSGRIDTAAKNLTLTNKLGFTGGGKFNLLDATKTNDFGSVAAQATATVTQTVTGAKLGDYVLVSLADPAGWNAGLLVSGFVSAQDTVTVQLSNITAGAINPESKVFNIRVVTR